MIEPSTMPPTMPLSDKPIRPNSGLVPALGAVAVVGIVALVAWGVLDNDAAENGQTPPAVTQTLPVPDPASPAATPDVAATPSPGSVATPIPEPMEAPDVTPLEVPMPAPEAAPTAAPAPVPAPTN